MMTLGALLGGTATAIASIAMMAPTAAHAQDVVVMRRVIAPPTKAMPVDPVAPPVGYYSWKVTDWNNPTLACGVQGTSTRTVRCSRTDNSTADDSFCSGNGAGSKPEATRTYTGSCGTGGGTGGGETGGGSSGGGGTGSGGGTPTPAVSPTPGETSSPSPGSTPTPGSTPATTPTPTPTSGGSTPDPTPALTYGWTASVFSAPSSTCGTATSSRTVACQRSDGAPASDDQCGSSRPMTTQTTYETSGCGYSWHEGEWDNPVAACGPTTQTRSVSCLRSDNQVVSDYQCAAVAKPAVSQPSTDYGKCSYAWAVGAYTDPNTTCGTVTQTRSVYCQRSDGPAAANAASCTETKPDSTQTSYDTTGCTFYWDKTAYGAATPACGASTHSRTVTCRRSDGEAATADKCVAGEKPIATEPATDYGTCTYKWSVGSWNGSAQCGQTVTQTRSVVCERSNGDPVGDSICLAKEGKPADSQPITDYTGCTYDWKTAPGAWSATCSSAATRANNVTCQRSEGTTVAENLCGASTRPQDVSTGNYAGCSYTSAYGDTYGTCAPTTPGATTGTQTAPIASCKRSDGTTVDNSLCTSKTTSRSCTPNYRVTGMAYKNCQPSGPGSMTGTETGTVSGCVDENGATAPASACTALTRACTIASYNPTYSATYGTCTAGTQSAPITSCSITATDTVTNTVPNNYCPNQTTSQSCTTAGPQCGTPVAGTWFSSNDGYRSLGKVATLELARNVCQAEATKSGAGACAWAGDSKYGDYQTVYYRTPQTSAYYGGGLYFMVCK